MEDYEFKVKYPTTDEIIKLNKEILNRIRVKKADRHNVLSKWQIEGAIDSCKVQQGDIYDKGVCLIKGLTQRHSFDSGNRRTAFAVTRQFILDNNQKFDVENSGKQARVLQGIRERYYTDDEIKYWLRGNNIREFKR